MAIAAEFAVGPTQAGRRNHRASPRPIAVSVRPCATRRPSVDCAPQHAARRRRTSERVVVQAIHPQLGEAPRQREHRLRRQAPQLGRECKCKSREATKKSSKRDAGTHGRPRRPHRPGALSTTHRAGFDCRACVSARPGGAVGAQPASDEGGVRGERQADGRVFVVVAECTRRCGASHGPDLGGV